MGNYPENSPIASPVQKLVVEDASSRQANAVEGKGYRPLWKRLQSRDILRTASFLHPRKSFAPLTKKIGQRSSPRSPPPEADLRASAAGTRPDPGPRRPYERRARRLPRRRASCLPVHGCRHLLHPRGPMAAPATSRALPGPPNHKRPSRGFVRRGAKTSLLPPGQSTFGRCLRPEPCRARGAFQSSQRRGRPGYRKPESDGHDQHRE